MTAYGLVTRWRSDTDGRAVLLSLTAEAEALIAAVHRRRTETFARAVARLPDDAREQLALAVPALAQLQRAIETTADTGTAAGPAAR